MKCLLYYVEFQISYAITIYFIFNFITQKYSFYSCQIVAIILYFPSSQHVLVNLSTSQKQAIILSIISLSRLILQQRYYQRLSPSSVFMEPKVNIYLRKSKGISHNLFFVNQFALYTN